MTFVEFPNPALIEISTHTLTWSVTTFSHVRNLTEHNFNSHAHVERDPALLTTWRLLRHFNSHAHVERDVQRTNRSHKTRISTHTLTWSVTRLSATLQKMYQYFNSHAHVERDQDEVIKCQQQLSFQLTRSRGA